MIRSQAAKPGRSFCRNTELNNLALLKCMFQSPIFTGVVDKCTQNTAVDLLYLIEIVK
jgi:hypothetical protein